VGHSGEGCSLNYAPLENAGLALGPG